jgi:signal transduction histidine kinase
LKKNVRIIYSIYGLLILIIIVISAIFYGQFQALQAYSDKVERTHEIIHQIETLERHLLSAENNQRAYFLRKDSSLLEPQTVLINKIKETEDSLQALVSDNKTQLQYLIILKARASERIMVMNQIMDYQGEKDKDKFEQNFVKGSGIMLKFAAYANKMKVQEAQALHEGTIKKNMYERSTPKFLLLVFVVTCIFQILSFAFLLSEFRTRQRYQLELEQKIQDLNATNTELEQIAFVASHDLQEPLRKIRTFSDRLVQKQQDRLDEEGKTILERITKASFRMQELMRDLINYTSLLQKETAPQSIDLNEVVSEVLISSKRLITKHNAVMNMQDLPIVQGDAKQLKLLFQNLVDNALKFSRPGISPIINISTTTILSSELKHKTPDSIERYFKVSVSDNGIGFDESFAHKIFIIFQRLHTQDSNYNGKGIGLAICRRIVMNHKGFIEATGEPGVGATFNLYFPILTT